MPELTVRFDGDWRVGTGKGLRGEVDERVRRDATGLPVVPARTLTGMWREAASGWPTPSTPHAAARGMTG